MLFQIFRKLQSHLRLFQTLTAALKIQDKLSLLMHYAL